MLEQNIIQYNIGRLAVLRHVREAVGVAQLPVYDSTNHNTSETTTTTTSTSTTTTTTTSTTTTSTTNDNNDNHTNHNELPGGHRVSLLGDLL